MAELHLYEVQHRNHIATLKLTEEDAEAYGDLAKKVGDVKPAGPQPVQRPPWAVEVDDLGAPVDDPADDEGETPAKQAPPARNKARSTKS